MKNNKGIVGLFEQIMNQPPSRLMTQSEIDKAIKKAEKAQIEYEKQVDMRIKSDMEHLKQRSKKLGKPIPTILGIYANSRTTTYLLDKFKNEFKEWF